MDTNEGTDKARKPVTPKPLKKLGSLTDDKGKGKGPLKGVKTTSRDFPYLKGPKGK